MVAASRNSGQRSRLIVRTMIGVITNTADRDIACEFFELFKTPWEFYRENAQYDIVLCNGDVRFDGTARLVIAYAGGCTSFDKQQRIPTIRRPSNGCVVLWQRDRIPVYGETVAFSRGFDVLTYEDSGEAAAYVEQSEATFCRVGYDLFAEVGRLLTTGQPAEKAALPALELHISFLRDLIVECGVPLLEVPPVPEGYEFIVCLTHDVDHPSIRRHRWDHTAIGFLYRATLGSLRNLFRNRISLPDLLASWAAAAKLPFVYLGVANDFWCDFAERYLEIEKGIPSTFFVIPFRGRAGKNVDRRRARTRAANYGARDVAGSIRKILRAGGEVGLHGIDAWLEGTAAEVELAEIRGLTGAGEIGVRMHWLCYNQQSPCVLEAAGVPYDSSIGYNETVGYKAGTMQAYRPLGAKSLLELPLHVMDTALFYPAHLGLSSKQADACLRRMMEDAVRFGGSLTINWHDRSTAPERLWGATYRSLIQELARRGAWFATARQAVSWFQERRTLVFEADRNMPAGFRVKATASRGGGLPGFRLRVHQDKTRYGGSAVSGDYVDTAVTSGDTYAGCRMNG